MEILGKTAVFPGGYGRIGEIPHGRIWPDMAGLESIGLIRLPGAHSWMNLALDYVGAYVFFHDSTESSDFKSAGCQDGIFGQL